MLRKYLPTVVAHTDQAIGRVIVADNGSSDDSVEMLRREFPEVELICFDRNYGFADGYNRALREVDAPLCVLLNSDVEVRDNWLEPLFRFMNAHEEYGACQPKIRSLAAPEMFEYAGAAGGYLDVNGYPYCRGRLFDTVEEDHGQYDAADAGGCADIFWATGAALMVRRELFNRLGGLDPQFFAHMEEIDLCWRIQLAGFNVAAVTESVVYHLGGGSLPAGNPRKTYLNFRNNLLMMHKNLPDSSRRRRLLFRRLLDTIAWARFVVTLQFANAGAVWRAHRDFARMRRAYTDHPDVDLLGATPESRVNLLWNYFARGRRHFSDLRTKREDSGLK